MLNEHQKEYSNVRRKRIWIIIIIMNREQMQNVLTDIYKQGAESVETASVDLDELRKAIGSISGIGEKRLDEIMIVIDEFVNK